MKTAQRVVTTIPTVTETVSATDERTMLRLIAGVTGDLPRKLTNLLRTPR